MGICEGVIIGIVVILTVIMLRYYMNSKRGFAKFLFGVLSGVGCLIAVSYFLPQYFTLNILSVSISALLGIPGVAMLLALGLI